MHIHETKDSNMPTVQTIPTGLPTLTEALGIGGWPRGYVTEIFGTSVVEKSVVLIPTILEAQRNGYVVALMDMACTFDPQAADAAGVNVSNLLVSQPETLDQALEIADALVRSGAVELVVIDGLNLLQPRGVGDADSVGRVSRMLSQAMRKLTASANRTQVAVIATTTTYLPQSRRMSEPERADAHQALKFYAALRVELRVSNGAVSARVVKNKHAEPFREAVLDTLNPAKA
jgi:recombination protein RecA